jgi:hypothetical protein
VRGPYATSAAPRARWAGQDRSERVRRANPPTKMGRVVCSWRLMPTSGALFPSQVLSPSTTAPNALCVIQSSGGAPRMALSPIMAGGLSSASSPWLKPAANNIAPSMTSCGRRLSLIVPVNQLRHSYLVSNLKNFPDLPPEHIRRSPLSADGLGSASGIWARTLALPNVNPLAANATLPTPAMDS